MTNVSDPAGETRQKLRTPEAARHLGMAAQTLRHWRQNGYGPAYIRLNRRSIVYDVAVLNAWLAERTYQPAA